MSNDTGAVMLLPELEGGVSLLQVLDDRHQSGCGALTQMLSLNIAFSTIYKERERTCFFIQNITLT